MSLLKYDTAAGSRAALGYQVVLEIRKTGARSVGCLLPLDQMTLEQETCVEALVRTRADGGSDYEAALAFDCGILIKVDGSCLVDYDGHQLVYTTTDSWKTRHAPQQSFSKLDDAICWLVENVELNEPNVLGGFGPN